MKQNNKENPTPNGRQSQGKHSDKDQKTRASL